MTSQRAPAPGGPPRATFGGNLVTALGMTLAVTLLGFVNSLVVARLAGPSGRGVYGLAVALQAVALPVASLGFGHAVTFALGRGEAPRRAAGLLWLPLTFWLLVGLGGVGAVWVGHGLPSEPTALAALAALAVLAPAVTVEFARGFLIGVGRMATHAVIAVCMLLALLTLNLCTLRLGGVWLLYNYVAALWFAGGLTLVTLCRAGVPGWPERALVAQSSRFGLRAALSQLADAALLRLDVVVMVAFVSLADVGIYAIADQLTHILSLFALAAARVVFADSAADAEGVRSRENLELLVRVLVPSLAVCSGVALVSAWWLIPVLFGHAFAEAFIGVVILVPAIFCKSLHALLGTYLAGQGRQGPVIRAGVVAVLLDLALIFLLAPTIGWQGVALAKVVAYAAEFLLVRRAYGLVLGPRAQLTYWASRDDWAKLLRFLRSRLSPG